MNDKRKGEIALLVLRNQLQKEGVRIGNNTKREIGSTAKELGIDIKEMTEFVQVMAREIFDKAFA